MGTWKLVEKPPDAVPITNKWVFAKKRNKEGQIVKYKARLVAKGCSQRPGYDYVETHSVTVSPLSYAYAMIRDSYQTLGLLTPTCLPLLGLSDC